MLKLWPGVYAMLYCFSCYLYGKWRRRHGTLVKPLEIGWIQLVTMPLLFAGMVLPSIMTSPGTTPADRDEMLVVIVAIGVLPLAVAFCFWGALRLVRLYIVHARSEAKCGSDFKADVIVPPLPHNEAT